MNLNFAKYSDGLIPAIVQDSDTLRVLMLGFMNAESIEETASSGRVTFYSRTKRRLWTKGETSGNFLELVSIVEDCDSDTLLIKAKPHGPACHKGTDTCFGETNARANSFLSDLESVIEDRRSNPTEGSYVSKLFSKGLNKIAQKVGEEAVETVIAAKDNDLEDFKNEAADLLFHYLVLLNAKGTKLGDIVEVLNDRRKR
jgi:phosphoribosyl-ATP pyrophosphohydrolase/phosphoribosyl-AMP cyclohydrolase